MGILRISKWGHFSTCLRFKGEEWHNCVLPVLVLSAPETTNWGIPVLISDTWTIFTEVNIDVFSSKTFIFLTFYLELSRENASLTHTPPSPQYAPVQEMLGNKPANGKERAQRHYSWISSTSGSVLKVCCFPFSWQESIHVGSLLFNFTSLSWASVPGISPVGWGC